MGLCPLWVQLYLSERRATGWDSPDPWLFFWESGMPLMSNL